MRSFGDTAQAALGRLDALDATVQEVGGTIASECRTLKGIANEVGRAWGGSYLGYLAYLYFERFEPPPPALQISAEWGGVHGLPQGWMEAHIEEVSAEVEKRGVQLDVTRGANELWDAAEDLVARCKAEGNNVDVDLTGLGSVAASLDEQRLLTELLEYAWVVPRAPRTPSAFITRDQEAMSQGPQLPPHLHYIAKLDHAAAQTANCQEFVDRARTRLRKVIRRIELQPALGDNEGSITPTADAVSAVVEICRRFPQAARALTDRKHNKPNYSLEDEYDVQDLLHTMLRIQFADVRPEEGSPSVGGKSPRLDFLLKEERLVVETKRTRGGLGGKEVADELAADVLRYAEHPDADVLVCFVYDPDHRIGNPAGLESDLARASSERLRVVAVVAQ